VFLVVFVFSPNKINKGIDQNLTCPIKFHSLQILLTNGKTWTNFNVWFVERLFDICKSLVSTHRLIKP